MIITRTPYRISFFGGGTDYHTWYQEHGGAVLSSTINYYCTLISLYKPPFFEYKHRIVWSEIEGANTADEIKHPVVREVLKHLDVQKGVEIFHQGDLPARSGLGSSSSFTVGMLNAMYSLRGQLCTKQELAAEAVYVERELLKENVGVQDQIAAAYGGFNKIEISRDGSFQVTPLPVLPSRLAELKSNLLLFFTGISRNASDIAKDKMTSIPKKTAELNEMRKSVDVAIDLLTANGDLEDFGKLMHENWKLKRSLTDKISNSFIDDIYQKAMDSGATGGKLLGAGGGGFILFYVKPENQPKVLEALKDLLWIPFDFENKGSHVAFYSPSSFSHESMMRRDYAHLQLDGHSDNLKEFMGSDKQKNAERLTKFNIIKGS
ncbi:MAG: kinase [Alphaproteobacteria bacterium CG11_big_fil_rev_8_21_14_0_20_44_7]|nr:MAG: kinase [Alphaproteobacteria bacterium CG11_big_fil_rev_8_21_14_0_20_44_7]